MRTAPLNDLQAEQTSCMRRMAGAMMVTAWRYPGDAGLRRALAAGPWDMWPGTTAKIRALALAALRVGAVRLHKAEQLRRVA